MRINLSFLCEDGSTHFLPTGNPADWWLCARFDNDPGTYPFWFRGEDFDSTVFPNTTVLLTESDIPAPIMPHQWDQFTSYRPTDDPFAGNFGARLGPYELLGGLAE